MYGTAQQIPIDEMHKLQAQSPYAASKISADFLLESFVRSFNIPAVILRPFNTYGPRQSERAVIPSIIRQLLDQKIKSIKVGNLETMRDFNYVKDTVNAFIAMAATTNKLELGTAYNAGTGKAVSIHKVLKKLISISGVNKKIIIDKKRFRPTNSEVYNLVASSKKLNKLTNWKPEFSLEQGLQEILSGKRRIQSNKIRKSSNYAI